MDTLKIVIMRQWFDEISAKTKTIEYRDVTPFWTSRLYDKTGKKRHYNRIEFINGYNKDARRMISEYLGFYIEDRIYCIKIGKIIEKNFNP